MIITSPKQWAALARAARRIAAVFAELDLRYGQRFVIECDDQLELVVILQRKEGAKP